MKRLMIILLVLTFAVPLAFAAKRPAAKNSVSNFKTQIEFINKSDAIITETITVNTTKKADVFRDLPKFYKTKKGSKAIHYDIISLRRNGAGRFVYARDNVSYLTVKYADPFSISLGVRPRRETRTYEIIYKMTNAASLINVNLPENSKSKIITFNNSAINNNPENRFGGIVLPFKKDAAVKTYPKPFNRKLWVLAINNMAWIYFTLIILLIGFYIWDLVMPKPDEEYRDKQVSFKTGLISSLVFFCVYQIRLFPPHDIGPGIITNNLLLCIAVLAVFLIIHHLTMFASDFIVTRFSAIRAFLGEKIITAALLLFIVVLDIFTFVQSFMNIRITTVFAVYLVALCAMNAMIYYIKPLIRYKIMEFKLKRDEPRRKAEEAIAEQKRKEEEAIAEQKRKEEEAIAEQKRKEEEAIAEQKRKEEEAEAEAKRKQKEAKEKEEEEIRKKVELEIAELERKEAQKRKEAAEAKTKTD
ncbi:MAG: hypothetical protein LBR69_03750 [Endomicrobium sp.]|jgi:hypothetical protein|nr:hypothetical protein [Endomicrobium sp.]